MGIPEHIIISGITAFGLTKIGIINPEEAFFIIGANCFDIDHVFSMVFETRSASVRKWIRKALSKQKIMQPGYFIFHTLEFNILFSIFSLLSTYRVTKIFAASWLLHMFYDFIWHVKYHKTNFNWIKHWSIFKWRKLWKESYQALSKN